MTGRGHHILFFTWPICPTFGWDSRDRQVIPRVPNRLISCCGGNFDDSFDKHLIGKCSNFLTINRLSRLKFNYQNFHHCQKSNALRDPKSCTLLKTAAEHISLFRTRPNNLPQQEHCFLPSVLPFPSLSLMISSRSLSASSSSSSQAHTVTAPCPLPTHKTPLKETEAMDRLMRHFEQR